MPSAFDQLVELIHSGTLESWKERNAQALASLFGSRYAQRAEKSVALRAPDMRGNDSGIPFAAYIHPSNPDSGGYSGMSFVIFPVENEPCLFGMVIGTQGLAPDEAVLGRPGHARKFQAICRWLNHRFGGGKQVAWAKQDPTRVDIDVPHSIQRAWSAYERVFKKYAPVLYALYRPTDDRCGTVAAVTAMLDVIFEERGHTPLKDSQRDSAQTKSAWFSHLMPRTESEQVVELLNHRRFVILQGPPGTGKTRMARRILANDYAAFGRSVQFHPSTTYETFIGGLAPEQTRESGNDGLGFRFAPRPGFLLEAAAETTTSTKPYLLHIDEINRADLSKILGEAIYLFEPDPELPRYIDLPYDFGNPFRNRFYLPPNAVEENGCELTQRAFKELLSIFVEHAPDEALPLVPGAFILSGEE